MNETDQNKLLQASSFGIPGTIIDDKRCFTQLLYFFTEISSHWDKTKAHKYILELLDDLLAYIIDNKRLRDETGLPGTTHWQTKRKKHLRVHM